jgi:ATP-dependent RNA helicase DDX21
VFDLPEEIAKELLSMELPPGNTITKITKVILQLDLSESMDNLYDFFSVLVACFPVHYNLC